jgi:hypothetical protein
VPCVTADIVEAMTYKPTRLSAKAFNELRTMAEQEMSEPMTAYEIEEMGLNLPLPNNTRMAYNYPNLKRTFVTRRNHSYLKLLTMALPKHYVAINERERVEAPSKHNLLTSLVVFPGKYAPLLFSVAIFLLIGASIVNAAPLYSPGQTLDPTCLPTNPDCTVTLAASSINVLFNYDVYSSTSIIYQHPRDPSELQGNTTGYAGSANNIGMHQTIGTTTQINSIFANVWSSIPSADITMKLFIKAASASTTPFNPDSDTPAYYGVINHTIMPQASSTTGYTFNLSSPVSIAAGQELFVIWEASTTGSVHIPRFSTDSGSEPFRNTFVFGTANSNWAFSDKGSGFYAGTFRVYGRGNITRQTGSGLGSEMIQNPGFENVGFANWSNGGFGSYIDETTLVHSGSHALKLASTNTNWYTPQATQSISVIGGQSYQLFLWTRGDGTKDGTYAIYDSTHSVYVVGVAGSGHTGITGTTYTQFTTSFTAPAGCTSIQIFLTVSQGAGAVAYFDDVSVKPNITVTTSIPISVQTLLNSFPASAVTFSDPNGIMTSTNVNSAIVEAYNHASSTTSATATTTLTAPRIVLPDNIYAVVGDELQLFVRGMIEAQNPYNFPYVIDSTVGSSYPRYFDYTPVLGDVGSHTLTAKVLNYDYSTLTSTSTNLVVVNPPGAPGTAKNILILGDSLTGGGAWPAELYRRLTQTGGTPAGLGYGNINFIGDIALPGYTTQGYDAWGGWAYSTYIDTANTSGHTLTGTFDKDSTDAVSTYTDGSNQWSIIYAKSGNILKIGTYGGAGSATLASSTLTWVSGGMHHSNIVYSAATNEPISPFWDATGSKIDFTAFTSRVGASGIDAVYVLLSWNSIFTSNLSTFSYLTQTQTFLNQLHTDYPNAVVRLMGVEIPSMNGGLGANYGGAGDAEYYGMVRTVNSNNIALQQLADQPAYSSWVKFIAVAPQFDSENNMSQSLTPVNTRNAATEYRGTNGVHPATAGYYQIADAAYREFVAWLSNSSY